MVSPSELFISRIVLESKIYELFAPLVCPVHREDGNYIIENTMLDIYAAGENIDAAEIDFYEEFDAAYLLLQALPDSELSDRLLRAKTMMLTYVREAA